MNPFLIFLGPVNAGKTTTAALLERAGFGRVSLDDIYHRLRPGLRELPDLGAELAVSHWNHHRPVVLEGVHLSFGSALGRILARVGREGIRPVVVAFDMSLSDLRRRLGVRRAGASWRLRIESAALLAGSFSHFKLSLPGMLLGLRRSGTRVARLTEGHWPPEEIARQVRTITG